MVVVSGVLAGVLVIVAVAAALATRIRTLEPPVRIATLVAELVVVLFTTADIGLVLRADAADRPGSLVTHLGYAVAAVALIPALTLRPASPDEPETEVEPVSMWVVVVALLAVAVCVVRLAQTR